MVTHAFDASESLNLRSAWSPSKSPDSQGYTEKRCLRKKKKKIQFLLTMTEFQLAMQTPWCAKTRRTESWCRNSASLRSTQVILRWNLEYTWLRDNFQSCGFRVYPHRLWLPLVLQNSSIILMTEGNVHERSAAVHGAQ